MMYPLYSAQDPSAQPVTQDNSWITYLIVGIVAVVVLVGVIGTFKACMIISRCVLEFQCLLTFVGATH